VLSASVLPESCEILTRSILHSGLQSRCPGCSSTHCELPVQVALVLWQSSDCGQRKLHNSFIYSCWECPSLFALEPLTNAAFDSVFMAIMPFSVSQPHVLNCLETTDKLAGEPCGCFSTMMWDDSIWSDFFCPWARDLNRFQHVSAALTPSKQNAITKGDVFSVSPLAFCTYNRSWSSSIVSHAFALAIQ